MATTFIPINTGTRLGQQLRQTIDQLQAAKQFLAKLKVTMDTQVDGAQNPASFALLESQFGLQAGQGETCYNLVAGTNSDLAASVNLAELLSWCG